MPDGARMHEVPHPSGLPVLCHPPWVEAFPWLFQGTTGRGTGHPFDLSFFGASPSGQVQERWRALRRDLGFPGVAHALQVHGHHILTHDRAIDGVFIGSDGDGHLSNRPGLLLAVSIADCVPAFLVDARRKLAGVLHAGWRGAAAGILDEGIRLLISTYDSDRGDLHLHLGPAICGRCYEVGPEVHAALGLRPPPSPAPVDLRALLASRALATGLPAGHISISPLCTRCDRDLLFSHRGGDRERQMGLIGIRAHD